MSNILLLMSGSIAVDKASKLIDVWQSRGDIVRVILTASVQHFIAADKEQITLEGIYTNTFAAGEQMAHIELGHWADQIIIAPATANLINKLAAGIADDMATTTMLAAYGLNKPTFIAPAMNTRMLEHPATQASLNKLLDWGYKIIPTGTGELACGEVGKGRLAEVNEIIASIDASMLMVDAPEYKGKVLITIGGVREAIDSVRYIGNSSSGATGSAIAEYLAQQGYLVTALCARHGIKPDHIECLDYLDFADLAQLLQSQLQANEYIAVIHAAAVSDYSVEQLQNTEGDRVTTNEKLASSEGLKIILKANPKLISQLRGWSKTPDIKIIGFKLTDTANSGKQQAAVMQLLQQAEIDAVVHNDMAKISAQQHQFHFYTGKGVTREDCAGSARLGIAINKWLEKNK